MSVEVSCGCGQRFAAQPHLYGKQVRCPSCGSPLSIPLPPLSSTSEQSITVVCQCGKRLSAKPNLAGKPVRCPACRQTILVPGGAEGPIATPKDDLWEDLSQTSGSTATQSTLPSRSYNPATYPKPRRTSRTEYRRYEDVPWYRQSVFNSAMILIHLLTCGCVPVLLIPCIILVTGDVYYNRTDERGNLKKWNIANKIIAIVILVVNVLILGGIFIAGL